MGGVESKDKEKKDAQTHHKTSFICLSFLFVEFPCFFLCDRQPHPIQIMAKFAKSNFSAFPNEERI